MKQFLTAILGCIVVGGFIGFALAQIPPLPPALPPVYFVVTATNADTQEESPESNEAVTTNIPASLSWRFDTANWPSAAFNLYWGRSSGRETNRIVLGNATTVVWPVAVPATNVVTISTANWNYTLTNPPGTKYFRAVLQSADSPLGPWNNCADIPRVIGIASNPK